MFNVATMEGASIMELGRVALSLSGSESGIELGSRSDIAVHALGVTLAEPVEERPRGEGDAYTILIDPSKTIETYGWRPQVSLTEGVPRTVEWYAQHGIDRSYTHLKQEE